MSHSAPSLSALLAKKHPKPKSSGKKDGAKLDQRLRALQLGMLRAQQGIWQAKARVIVVFEGFDAAGKGGAIRALTRDIDPRGIRVHPIAAPAAQDQAKHYLYRFWKLLPAPGMIAVFDRSWNGRVLVERVDKLAPGDRIKDAYREIIEFERLLVDDGVEVIKFFLGVSADEQLRRFEERLADPYKQWKLSEDDIRARAKWPDYVKAADKMLKRTHSRRAPWHLIAADDKHAARERVLETTLDRLRRFTHGIEGAARSSKLRSLATELGKLEKVAR